MKLSTSVILVAVSLVALASGIQAQGFMLKPLFSITGAELLRKISMPSDVFVDDVHGEIYVVDAGNRRVLIFEMDGFYKHQFVIPGAPGELTSLVVDGRGEILVAVGGKVAVCDFRGSLLEYVDFQGFPDADKIRVTRLAVDSKDNHYVVDVGKQRVLAFDSDWNFRFAIDKESFPKTVRNLTHRRGQEQSTVQSLSIGDICVDDEGMIYMIDPMASYVYAFNDEAEYVCSIGEPGATFATLSLPTGVAVDSQGRVLVVDATGHGILGYDKNGRRLFALGGMGREEGRLYFPKYVSTDGDGRIYVIEPFLNRVQVLRVEDGIVPTRLPSSLPVSTKVTSPPLGREDE